LGWKDIRGRNILPLPLTLVLTEVSQAESLVFIEVLARKALRWIP
jgi:hypothetical protein